MLQLLLEIRSLKNEFRTLKLPPDFHTDPLWRKEQANYKEQLSTKNEGIYIHSFFSPPECKPWYSSYFVVTAQAELASRKL